MTRRQVEFPTGFRNRLAATIVLSAGVTAGLLALGSWLFVQQARRSTAHDRALRQTEFNLALADDILSTEPEDHEIDRLLRLYERREGFEAIILRSGLAVVASDPQILASMDREIEGIQNSDPTETKINGEPFLVSGGDAAAGRVQLRFFFPQGSIQEELDELRNILGIAWLCVLGASALTGRAVARRTLNPVIEASHAARSLAEGLLDTRIPVETADEFGVLATSFNEMADEIQAMIVQLSEAHAREKRFTSDVSHELRTPVAALSTAASLLHKHLDVVPAPARRPAELMVGDATRLRSLVEELMEIARLDSDTPFLATERVDVRAFLEEILRANGWDAEVSLNADSILVTTDVRRLQRIVVNLIDNARQHGAPPVEVSTAERNGWVTIDVCDAGTGIPEQDLPHIFDRFYKSDPSRSSSGSGLGLAIALENARLVGGTIDVITPEEQGTRFRLQLPSGEVPV